MIRSRRFEFQELEELLNYYFNGDLETIIKNFKNKVCCKLSDDLYITYTAIDNSRDYTTNGNGYSDPTGSRAARLADLSQSRIKLYKRFKNIKKDIERVILALNDDEMLLIKAYIGLITWKETEQHTGINYSTGKRQARQLMINLSEELKELFYFIGLNQDESLLDIDITLL